MSADRTLHFSEENTDSLPHWALFEGAPPPILQTVPRVPRFSAKKPFFSQSPLGKTFYNPVLFYNVNINCVIGNYALILSEGATSSQDFGTTFSFSTAAISPARAQIETLDPKESIRRSLSEQRHSRDFDLIAGVVLIGVSWHSLLSSGELHPTSYRTDEYYDSGAQGQRPICILKEPLPRSQIFKKLNVTYTSARFRAQLLNGALEPDGTLTASIANIYKMCT